MSLRVRRVVTGHDANGRAMVASDAVMANATSARPGLEGCVVWASDRIPVDNLDPRDGAQRTTGVTLPGGAVFRVVQYGPDTEGRMHRTRTLDHGVVLSGEVVLELDDGVEVTLHAGDVLVQRGTIHKWINRAAEPCTVAFFILDAEPLPGEAAHG